MDDALKALSELSNLGRHPSNGDGFNGLNDGDGEEEEEYDLVAWETFMKCFREVQSILNQNRTLIQQVNENHQSKLPDNLVKNVALIRDINRNISEVSRLYSDLSVDFCNIVHRRRQHVLFESKNCNDNMDSAES